jgi:two-component system osmolarity sensor histidine kinase EnvZ
MKEKIKNHIDQRTLMLSSISHDLKTSLTRMQLILELTDEIKNESFYKDLIKEINNMNDMIKSYLEFAKTGIKIAKIKENIDVVILIKKCISRIKKKKKIEIVKNTDEVSIEVNESSLTRILNNIIDNAVSYSNKIIITIKIYTPDLNLTLLSWMLCTNGADNTFVKIKVEYAQH